VDATVKKRGKQLEREIAANLAAQGQPDLAAMFASPEARRTFAREMRHEIYKKQTSERSAAAMAARPYSVKRVVTRRMADGDVRGVRELVGNFATEGEARSRADQTDGWVELRDGTVVYGTRKEP
jgi:hypothetical protein